MHPSGPLIQTFGSRIVYGTTLSLRAKVSAVIAGNSWNWRPARSDTLVDIQAILCDSLYPIPEERESIE